LKREAEAVAIEQAVDRILAKGHRTADLAAGGTSVGTVEMGSMVLAELNA
jgi:3-isopropylmalate dehydrogenase